VKEEKDVANTFACRKKKKKEVHRGRETFNSFLSARKEGAHYPIIIIREEKKGEKRGRRLSDSA